MLAGSLGSALAQGAQSVDQVARPTQRRDLATSPAQVKSPASRESVSIGQLPGGLTEKTGPATSDRIGAMTEQGAGALELTPSRPRSDTVDADEIARILVRGDATTIDAAAAIASGAGDKPKPPPPPPDRTPPSMQIDPPGP